MDVKKSELFEQQLNASDDENNWKTTKNSKLPPIEEAAIVNSSSGKKKLPQKKGPVFKSTRNQRASKIICVRSSEEVKDHS